MNHADHADEARYDECDNRPGNKNMKYNPNSKYVFTHCILCKFTQKHRYVYNNLSEVS